jgi:hypothetical protein
MALKKLKIIAYKTEKRSNSDVVGSLEVMFNPETYNLNYNIEYAKAQAVNTTSKELVYTYNPPSDLVLKIIFDNTILIDKANSNTTAVQENIEKFLKLTYVMNSDIHEPNYLEIKWGDLSFFCRLKNVDIKYTLFNIDGKPLRAELDTTFCSDEDVKKRLAEENKQSPDLTHKKIIESGAKLFIIANEIYNDPVYYIKLAEVNKLNNFRKLKAGNYLHCPPIKR